MYYKENSCAKIFLSYHSSKLELVEHLSQYLEKNQLNTWYASRDIKSGESWPIAIDTAIKECKVFVLLFCKEADLSEQVLRELSLADKYKKPIIWLRVEHVEPTKLSYFLTSTQWFDWLDTRDAVLEALIKDIHTIQGGSNLIKYDNNERKDLKEVVNEPNNWTKGIIAFNKSAVAAECAAHTYFSLAQQNPDSSVVLPTGRSATTLFKAMLRVAEEYEGCPFGEAKIISDTETFGVWQEHPTSRTKHINDALIKPLKEMNRAPEEEQLELLSGIYMNSDPIQNAYNTLREFPPVIHAISVSPVGEILGYEVGTYNTKDEIIDDTPCVVEVGKQSKKYIDPNQPSQSIITIGLGSALSADVLLILVFDKQKASILNQLLTTPARAGIPATLLNLHHNAYILTTESIVEEAKLSDIALYKKDAKETAAWIIKN